MTRSELQPGTDQIGAEREPVDFVPERVFGHRPQHLVEGRRCVRQRHVDPDRSDYYNGMGLTYYRKKSYAAALKLFVTASEVDPNDATARYNQACVLSLMGRRDEAINTLAEALSLDPRLMQSARADADFAAIKGSEKFQALMQNVAH